MTKEKVPSFQSEMNKVLRILSLNGKLVSSPSYRFTSVGHMRIDNIDYQRAEDPHAFGVHEVQISPRGRDDDYHSVETFIGANIMYGEANKSDSELPSRLSLMNQSPFEVVLSDSHGVNNWNFVKFHYVFSENEDELLKLRLCKISPRLRNCDGGFKPIGTKKLDEDGDYVGITGAILGDKGYTFTDIKDTARFMVRYRRAIGHNFWENFNPGSLG